MAPLSRERFSPRSVGRENLLRIAEPVAVANGAPIAAVACLRQGRTSGTEEPPRLELAARLPEGADRSRTASEYLELSASVEL